MASGSKMNWKSANRMSARKMKVVKINTTVYTTTHTRQVQGQGQAVGDRKGGQSSRLDSAPQ